MRGRAGMTIRAAGFALGFATVALAGCDSAPRHDPSDPFYVGHVRHEGAHAPDPSVGQGRSPIDAQSAPGGGVAGPYMSGAAGGN